MRSLVSICCAISLTACVTAPPQSGEGAIGASSLKAGECGLFGWSTDRLQKFIFFADAKTARYDSSEGPVDLKAQGKFPALEYLDGDGKSVTLRLGQGEVMNGGMRYSQARIVTLTQEGWERLQPVAIVKSCQPE